jgi:transcriptional regulator with XRE-family HTH domain
MVPKKVGEELRRRRMLLGLRQADIARAMNTTRAYVSAIERGVEWDPDADKLVVWAQTLGWPNDYVLRTLGRAVMSTTGSATLTADLLEAIRRAVAEGVAAGVTEALQDRQAKPGDTGQEPGRPNGRPRAPLA